MKLIRIVLADDHWLMRDETRRIFEQYPDLKVVGEAEDGRQAMELIEQLQPDVVILDIRMPELSGIEVVRGMKERSPGTKALILTAYDDDAYILNLIEAGALGYLLKTTRTDELIDAVRRVHLGETVLQPAIANKIAHLWRQNQQSTRQEGFNKLSIREQEVLQLVTKGLRNKAIADELNISDRTVEAHLNSIFAKLGVSSRVEVVLYALSRHIVSLEEEDSS